MDKFKLLSLMELNLVVKNLKKNKRSINGITVEILQKSFEVIGYRFLQLIHTSLDYGTFRENWKKSVIDPIEKKANTIRYEEYRPLNMIPVYEK